MSPVARVALVLVVLGLAVALGYLWRSRNGRFTAVDPAVLAAAGCAPVAPGRPPDLPGARLTSPEAA